MFLSAWKKTENARRQFAQEKVGCRISLIYFCVNIPEWSFQ